MVATPTYAPFRLKWFEIHAVNHCNLSCVYCNAHSPFFKKQEYDAETYLPWIDEINRRNILFDSISIIGGEPFLHSNLAKFVKTLKDYTQKNLILTTNGFWLKDQVPKDVLSNISVLFVSLYEGKTPLDKIKEIKETFPELTIHIRKQETFFKFEFTSIPEKVTQFCYCQADCTNLLPDGRLSRCGVGGWAHKHPFVTNEFLNTQTDMFYDIKIDDGRDFGEWRTKWPLDSCQFCTMWKNEKTEWENNPAIRKLA